MRATERHAPFSRSRNAPCGPNTVPYSCSVYCAELKRGERLSKGQACSGSVHSRLAPPAALRLHATVPPPTHPHDGPGVGLYPRQALLLHDERGEERVAIHHHCRRRRRLRRLSGQAAGQCWRRRARAGLLHVHATAHTAAPAMPCTAGRHWASCQGSSDPPPPPPVPPPEKRLMSGTPWAAAAPTCTSSCGFLHGRPSRGAVGGNAGRQAAGSSRAAHASCAIGSSMQRAAMAPRHPPADAQHDGGLRRAVVDHKPVVLGGPAAGGESETLAARGP